MGEKKSFKFLIYDSCWINERERKKQTIIETIPWWTRIEMAHASFISGK